MQKSMNATAATIMKSIMNAADRVYIQPEEPGETVPEFRRFGEGLGITKINVLPHYQMVKDNYLDGRRLFEDVTFADSYGECFHVFPDGTYLLVENGKTTLFGEAYRIFDGKMDRISQVGDALEME